MASALSMTAGYVDAVGFMMTGGFFVSFMSGNSTRLAVGLVHEAAYAALALSLICAFVAGVSVGAFVGRTAKTHRGVAVLILVSLLLTAAATLASLGADRPAILMLALAMGAENTVFAQDGEVRIGLTYMTGTLVKLGKHITAALLGGDRFGWVPYFLLWLGLVGGAALGATAYLHVGPRALWGAAGAMALLALTAAKLPASFAPAHDLQAAREEV
ncbi:YoaK family protein [Phenylobacterium sp. Root700]|uniref:YoaK family protein n=1 Tax=Phenylobacterium sp. Root700 TaxID=1736591 RepID=UPI0035122EC9